MSERYDVNQALTHIQNLFPEPWPGHVILIISKTKEKEHRQLRATYCLDKPSDLTEIPQHMWDLYMLDGCDFYFCCGYTDGGKSGHNFSYKKENIRGNCFLWVDVDDITLAQAKEIAADIPCKPTGYVRSGGGYHFYWVLNQFHDKEDKRVVEALKRLEKWTGGDRIAKINQILSLPGGFKNKPWKYDVPPAIYIEEWDTSIVYTLESILQHKITGKDLRVDRDFYEKHILQGECFASGDRSTRDFAIMKELLKAGHTRTEVEAVFKSEVFACSEKVMERNGDSYFNLTFTNALAEVGNNAAGGVGIVDDGKVVTKKTVDKHGVLNEEVISNFAITPIEMHFYDDESFGFICRVVCGDMSKTIRADARACTNSYNFRGGAGLPGLSWTGSETDFQGYIAYVRSQVTDDMKFPATRTAGWFKNKVVTAKYQLGPSKYGEVRYWDKAVAPKITLSKRPDLKWEEFMEDMCEHLFKLNHPRVSFLSFGWFAAALLAPQIRRHFNRQFPILCLSGEPGSGKTTTAITLNRALCGVESDYSYEGTPAALRRILSSTNCFPVFIDEYESKNFSAEKDTYLRLAWQKGIVPKCDRSSLNMDGIEDLPLQAPVVLGTMTGITDDALRDRMTFVRVRTHERPKSPIGISWFRNLSPGYFARNWFREPVKEILDYIKHAMAAIELQEPDITDRQILANGIPLGVANYCNKKYWGGKVDWKIIRDIADIEVNTYEKETPETLIDFLLNYMIRNPGVSALFLDKEWRINAAGTDDECLVIHQSHFYAKAPMMARQLQMPAYSHSKQWIMDNVRDLKASGKVKKTSAPTRYRDVVNTVNSIYIYTSFFPKTREAMLEILSDRSTANYG